MSSRGRVRHGAEGAGVTLDFSSPPIVEIAIVGLVDDADFRRYLDDVFSPIAYGNPYALLFDARRAGLASARQRRMQAEGIRQHELGLARHCRGAAFVIDSAAIRGALTAILWIAPMPMDHVVLDSMGEAREWLRKRF